MEGFPLDCRVDAALGLCEKQNHGLGFQGYSGSHRESGKISKVCRIGNAGS